MKLDVIYNEDWYEGIKKIPDKSIDLIVTDPPYAFGTGGVGTGLFKYRDLQNTYTEIRDNNLDKSINLDILNEYVRVMKKINIYLWCNKEQIYDYMTFFVKEKKCNFEFIIWAKSNVPPFTSGHYLKDKEYCLYFWEQGVKLNGNYDTLKTVYMGQVNVKDKEEYGHPTIKPLDIIKNLIENSSEVGGVVLDTFMGSGTTAVACQELNRHFIGFELNPKYYQIAIDRVNGINQKERKMKDAGFQTIFDFL